MRTLSASCERNNAAFALMPPPTTVVRFAPRARWLVGRLRSNSAGLVALSDMKTPSRRRASVTKGEVEFVRTVSSRFGPAQQRSVGRAPGTSDTRRVDTNGRSEKPNIVMIMADDVATWNLSAYHRGVQNDLHCRPRPGADVLSSTARGISVSDKTDHPEHVATLDQVLAKSRGGADTACAG